ncbi:hypothetical protein DW103_08620 [Parabacteroides sp. AM08-6]|nr:hypothetical protein DW103_08620 [Parabacteroides sp. AM08-6]
MRYVFHSYFPCFPFLYFVYLVVTKFVFDAVINIFDGVKNIHDSVENINDAVENKIVGNVFSNTSPAKK